MTNTQSVTRKFMEPNAPISVGGDPERDRCFIRRDIQEWSSHPYKLPADVTFTEADKELGRASDSAWAEMQYKGPIHCNDAFIIRPTDSGSFEVLTIERQEWPIAGERWMIGGRDVTPPADHPLAAEWLPDHSMLLTMYREVGVQPHEIIEAYPLVDVQFTFVSPDDSTKMKQTPATLWLLVVDQDCSIQLDRKESQKSLWHDLETLSQKSMIELKLCEYMRFSLSKIQAGLPFLRSRTENPDSSIDDLSFPE